MDWETADTDLGGIDIENSTYRITTDQFIEPLVASIEGVGLLNPPFLLPTGGRYTIVSGFRRVAAYLQLGHIDIPARVLKPEIPGPLVAKIAICENSSERPLNLVETSRSLHLLARHVEDPLKLEQACRRLGLPDHPSMRKKIMRVCRMPVSIQEGIIEDVISLNTALMLDDLGTVAGLILADIFRNLHLSYSKQREILTHLVEITRRDKISPGTFLEDAQLHALLCDPETSSAQKGNMLRHHFRSHRFPFLTLAQESFLKESRKLSLGDNIRLRAPSGFESPEYVFTIGIKNLSDLETGIKVLQTALHNPALKNILTRS